MAAPTITKIEHIYFTHEIQDMGADYNGFNQVYEKGAKREMTSCIARVHTSEGIIGEHLGGTIPDGVARYLIGKNPFAREKIYNDLKRGMRHTGVTALCSADVALWDFAGKAYGAPVWQLLGGWRETIPAYASTYHGDENGGLDTPQAFADFAERCCHHRFHL
jgi:L-alanine-DL-glutamate epimerase-like enolase superfamily enzyme